ncbi:hypothetical protein M569_04073 [Genlisea aurea]|uniref:Uncharacterized protein n=1 Tax=Genlisea aurea TaxID=192259 RepID=S8CTT1_9LAMI|nr:hypothetical protein M569_04073 [Genlisea aurea]
MANSAQIVAIFAGALILFALGDTAVATDPEFFVQGQVFCEVCRTNFINRLSEPMEGATVRLECRGDNVGNITFGIEGVTDAGGNYKLKATGDHEDEDCQVTLVKSSRLDCQETPSEGWAMQPSSKITITKNNGFHDDIRHANPLGFTKKERDPACQELFKELQINPDSLA